MPGRYHPILAIALVAGLCLAAAADSRAQGQLGKPLSELVQLLRSGGHATTLITRNDRELVRILSQLQGAIPPVGSGQPLTGAAPRMTEPLPPEIKRLFDELDQAAWRAAAGGPLGAEAFAPLESEVRGLAPSAYLELRGRRLAVVVDEPQDLLRILEASRGEAAGKPSVLAGCELSACFGTAEVSLSGSCGALGLDVSSRGSATLGVEVERASMSVQLSKEGIEIGTGYRPGLSGD